MSNKIKAAIRVRPFVLNQKKQGFKNNLIEVNQNKKEINIKQDSNTLRKFQFDYLFDQSSTQEDIYSECKIDQMIDKAIEGYHSTIFAYGQTGSGKTYTMQGTESIQEGVNQTIDGIIPQLIKNLFKKIEKLHRQRTFSISVSFLQIYNQKIFDLLNPASLNNKNLSNNINGLRLRWNKDQQFSVENLFVFECKNQQQLTKFFMYGLKNRISSAHRLNMQSSRSHSILSIRLESFANDNPTHSLLSKIQLVDLAGSQRIGMTGTQGRLAKQSIDINKSLFTLRQVISILAEVSRSKNKQKVHVPYRDSKLTSILKQSIGGNSYCLMIACINPNDHFLEQNISTLTYATKASYITNQPVVNDDPRNKLISQLKKQVKQLNEELGKANQHIEFMGSFNELNIANREHTNNSFNQPNGMMGHTYSHKGKGFYQNDLDDNQNDMPVPLFKKKFSQKVNNNYGDFSQRLIESINMVRQLLKSNKQLREQMEIKDKLIDEKNVQIYELTRENQMLRQTRQSSTNFFPQPSITGSNAGNSNFQAPPFYQTQRIPTAKRKISQGMTSNNIYGIGSKNAMNQSRGNFNYWNSVEINQFYMNERGLDSIPTNFNKRQINTAQDKRNANTRGKSSESERHAITAKISTRRNWINKHSQPKKILSFYNDSQRQGQIY